MSNYNFSPTLDGLNNLDSNNVNSNTIITDYLTVNIGSSVPTLANGTNNNSIASTAFVTNAISDISNYVTTNTIQTITATKTFSALQNIPSISGKYIDLFAGQLRMFSGTSGGSAIYIYVPPSGRGIIDFASTNCDMVGQYNLTSNNMTCSFAPTSANEYTNKNYVDSEIAGGLTSYVNISGTQTITGQKTFTASHTDFSGNIQSDITPTNYIQLTDRTINDKLTIGSKNMDLNTTQSFAVNSGGYTTFSSAGNVYFSNPSSATKFLQIVDVNNTPLNFIISTGLNQITSSTNLNINSSNNISITGSSLSVGCPTSFTNTANANTLNSNTATSNLVIADNQTSGVLNIGNNSSRTGTVSINAATTNNSSTYIGSVNSSTSLTSLRGSTLRLNKDFTTITNTIEIGSGNSWSTTNINSLLNVYGYTIFDDNVLNNFTVTNNDKCYFNNGADFHNNCFFDGTVNIQQALPSDINIGVNSHTDNIYFNFGAPPSSIAQLRLHYVNALNKFRLSQQIAGKSFALGIGSADYIVLNPTTTYCDIPKMSTGFVDIAANTINAKSGFSLALQLNGTNMIQLDNTTSKVFMGPTRCSSYLEVVGETQANNPIELNYNPSSISAGRLGFQYYSTSTTNPVVNGSKNITFTSTGLDYFTLPLGVWLCELYSGWAQQSNNRAVSLSATTATIDNSRACYSTQQNTSFQELTFTTALSVTNSATPYYFVISCGANGGSPSFSSVQHYLRCTRIA